MIYLQLLYSYLKIGFFGFGGGYAMLALIHNEIVVRHHWLTNSELTDIIAISQMTPGPIAVNSATFVGIKIAGIGGAFAATAGCIFPSCIIVTVIARLYLKYRNMDLLQGVLQSLRPAVVAMIASAGVSILVTAFWENADKITILNTNWTLVVLFVLAVFAIRRFKMNPICVMILAGVAKVVVSFAGL